MAGGRRAAGAGIRGGPHGVGVRPRARAARAHQRREAAAVGVKPGFVRARYATDRLGDTDGIGEGVTRHGRHGWR